MKCSHQTNNTVMKFNQNPEGGKKTRKILIVLKSIRYEITKLIKCGLLLCIVYSVL